MRYDIKMTFEHHRYDYKMRIVAKTKAGAIRKALKTGLALYHSEELRSIDVFPEGTFFAKWEPEKHLRHG